jgi:nitroreductase
MTALETILNRKSIPLMEKPKPTQKELKNIYKAALRAPDHGSLTPWKFIEVSGNKRNLLSKIFVKATKRILKNPNDNTIQKVKNAPFRAPLIIIVVATIKKKLNIPKIEQILSAGAAAQNIMLAASFYGYYSIWRTGHLAFNDNINKLLKLKKDDVVVGYLYIGSTKNKAPSTKKLNVDDFVKKL